MKWTTTAGLVVALGLVGTVTKGLVSPSRENPRDVLQGVRDRSEVPSFDRRQALRELERALSHPRARQDDDLTVELLIERANLFERLGATADARLEVERVLGVYRPDDVHLQLRSAELQAKEGLNSEALEKVSRVIERDPSQGAAWRLRGRLEVRLGEDLLNRASERADETLIQEDFERAQEIMPRIAAMDKNDSSRARILHELRQIYTERKSSYLADVLELLDDASRYYGQARSSFARAFSEGVDPHSLRAWLDLMVLAGQAETAVDFGIAARTLPEIGQDPAVLAGLLEAMGDLGQTARMINMVRSWPWDKVAAEPEFYRRVARALYLAGDRRVLTGPVDELRKIGSPTDRNQTSFYKAAVSQDRAENHDPKLWTNSINQLQDFLDTRPGDPVPGARSIAYRMLARAWREVGRPRDEMRAVRGAIETSPRSNGEDYLRLVEIQRTTSTVSFRIPEENWTLGMSLLPKRTAELMPTWRELGETALNGQDLDFDEVYERVRKFNQTRPGDVGPYTIYRIALKHLELNNSSGAAAVARGLLEDYPGLLPAIDITLDALAQDQAWFPLGRRLLERIRLVGPDERSRQFLQMLPTSVFSATERLELVEMDPYAYGREHVAQHLLNEGLADQALAALRLVEGQPDYPELKILRGRSLLELERWKSAAEEVQDLVLDPRYDERAFPIVLEARLKDGSPENVSLLADELLARDPIPRDLVLVTAREVLAAGQLALAERLLERLDSQPETRGGDVLHLMALRAALSDDRPAALEALERAEAFFDDGRAEILRVVLLADARAWRDLPRAVSRLSDTDLNITPLQQALLPQFGEQVELGLELARAGLRDDSHNPTWALAVAGGQLLADLTPTLPDFFGASAGPEAARTLRGSADAKRDPREILALLLALDIDDWALWVRKRNRSHFEEGGGSLWLQFLDAQASELLGNRLDAEANFLRMTRGLPDFGPGWERLEQAVRLRHPTNPLHPEVLEVLANKARALGGGEAKTVADKLLSDASRQVGAGRIREAVEVLTRALRREEESELPIHRLFLARLTAELGLYSESAEQYTQVFARQERRSDHPWIPEFLDLLSRAGSRAVARRDQLSEVEIAEILDNLQLQFPADPLVSLARLRTELASDSRNIPLSVRRAEGALRVLRREGEERVLDDLRPGSAAIWIDFLLELSPELASEQIALDQETRLGDLNLWIARARILEAQGRFQAAEDAFAHLIAMSDDPKVHGEYARLLTRRGAALPLVRQHLENADADSGRRSSPRSDYLLARGTLYSQRTNLGVVANRLSNLWKTRDEFRGEVPPLELGRVYATTLFQISNVSSLRRLRGVTEDMARYTQQDPYAPDLVQAFTNLARAANSLNSKAPVDADTESTSADPDLPQINNESESTEVPVPNVALPGQPEAEVSLPE